MFCFFERQLMQMKQNASGEEKNPDKVFKVKIEMHSKTTCGINKLLHLVFGSRKLV